VNNNWRNPTTWLLIFTLIATAVAACYTKKQWETADDTERRGLRSYLATSVGDDIVMAADRAHATIDVKSLGQTPAYNVHATIILGYWGILLTEDEIRNEDDAGRLIKFVVNESIINPRDSVKVPIEWTGSKPYAEAIAKDGFVTFYLLGKVDYRDAFGCFHYISYCYRLSSSDATKAEECAGRNKSDDPAVCTQVTP
jgi:hypothetical protein